MLTKADVPGAVLKGSEGVTETIPCNVAGLIVEKIAAQTQQELAVVAGISKPYLSRIETGKRQGTVETLSPIARSLQVPNDVLTY